MSSSSSEISLDNFSPPPPEQLCYVHCNFCNTVLAVSVPCSSWFKTVTVRCGHCTNLLSVNTTTVLTPPPPPPAAPNQLHHFLPPFLNPSPPPSLLVDPAPNLHSSNAKQPVVKWTEEERPHINTPNINRPPEKRQRVPSAYNRFIKNEIQRIKAANPDITHREAFSAAAKNWAHFPHIQYGMMHDQVLKNSSIRNQQEGEDAIFKDGFYAAAAAKFGSHAVLANNELLKF